MKLNVDYQIARDARWFRSYFIGAYSCLTLIVLLGILNGVRFRVETALLSLVLHVIGGVSITAGYHRLWTHRSYHAATPLQYALAIIATTQGQYKIWWWVRHHRAHHRYVDTDRDPYDSRQGFYFTHVGWLFGYEYRTWGEVDMSDIESDPVVLWQDRYFWRITLLVCLAIPTMVAHFGWNDWKGALVYAYAGRLLVGLNSTFLVNSMAHSAWAGSQPYSVSHSARNVPLLTLFTAGEANHNFHHTFPTDYRNGMHWYDMDISRYFIWTWSIIGLASHLQRVKEAEIRWARWKERNQGQIQENTAEITDSPCLPTIGWEEYVHQASHGRCLVCISGVVYDVAEFVRHHPGGQDLILNVVGKDGTDAFHAENVHSTHAKSLLTSMRIASVLPDDKNN